MRIALLTEIPAPFRIPIFNALAALDDVDLDVLFLSDRDPKRPYRVYSEEFAFTWRVLRGWSLVRGGRWVLLNRGVLRELVRARPDVVVVGGWNQPAFWQALLYAAVRRVPLVAWVESTARDERRGRGPAELLKRLLVRASAGFLVPGRASAEYVETLGVAPERIAVAPNAADDEIFGRRVAEARERREDVRARLGVDGVCALFVGRLDPEKGVDVLLEAMRGLPEVSLVAIGAGSQDEQLRGVAPANVRFLGWVEREDIVEWYAAADLFVLPSRSDQWALVLNEAAAAALPLVATEAPGAAHDLIEDGVNGFRVPTGDADALRAAIAALAADEPLRRSAGERSRELAAGFSADAWATAVASLARRLLR